MPLKLTMPKSPSVGGAWSKQDKIGEVPPIQRERLDSALFDDTAERGLRRVDKGSIGSDAHGDADVPNFKLRLQRRCRSDTNDNLLISALAKPSFLIETS